MASDLKAGDPYPGKPGYILGSDGSAIEIRDTVRVKDANAPGGANNPISYSEAIARYGTDYGVNVSGVPTKPYVEGHDSRQIPTTPEDLAFTLRTRGDDAAVKRYAAENPEATRQAEKINEAYRPVDIPISNPRQVNPGMGYETTTSTGQRITLMASADGGVSVSGTREALAGSGERLTELGLTRLDSRLYGTGPGEPGTVGGIPFTPASMFGYEKRTGGVVQFYPPKPERGNAGGIPFTPASMFGVEKQAGGIVTYSYKTVDAFGTTTADDYQKNFPSLYAVTQFGKELAVKLEGDDRNLGPVGKAGGQFLASYGVELALIVPKLAALGADLINTPGGLPPESVRERGLGGAFAENLIRTKGTQAAILGAGIVLAAFKPGRVALIGATAAYGVYETVTAPKGELFRTAGRGAADVSAFFIYPKAAESFAKSRITVSQGVPEARVSATSDLTFSTRKMAGGQKVYPDVFLGTKQSGTAQAFAVAKDRLGNLYEGKVGGDFLTFTQPSGKTTVLFKGAAIAGGEMLPARSGGVLLPFEKGGPYQTFSFQNVGGRQAAATGYAFEATSTKGFYEFFPSGKMVAPASQVTRYPYEKTAFMNYERVGGGEVVGGGFGFSIQKGKPTYSLDINVKNAPKNLDSVLKNTNEILGQARIKLFDSKAGQKVEFGKYSEYGEAGYYDLETGNIRIVRRNDPGANMGATLAHEIGHALGLKHKTVLDSGNLMDTSSAVNGRFLSPKQIETATSSPLLYRSNPIDIVVSYGKPIVTQPVTRVKTLGVFERIGKPEGELDLSRLGSFAPEGLFPAGGPTQTRIFYPSGDVSFTNLAPVRSGGGMAQFAATRSVSPQVGGGVLSMVSELAGQAAAQSARTQNVAGGQAFTLISGAVAVPRQGTSERMAPSLEMDAFVLGGRTAPVSRQTQAPRSALLPDLATAPETAFLTRQAGRTVQVPQTAFLPDTSILPSTAFVPQTVVLTRTQTVTRSVMVPSGEGFTSVTPFIEIIPGPVPPWTPGGGIEFGGGFGERPTRRGKRKYQYTPSLVAIAFDFRAASIPKVAFGEAVRPIIGKKRRGSKPLFGEFAF